MEYENFDKLTEKVVITGHLVTKTQLHIGSGEKGEIIDQLHIKVNVGDQKVPYIPGSSLKGVFRSMIGQVFSDKNDKLAEQYLFGKESTNIREACAAHLRVFDCLPVNYKKKEIPLINKPGVAIDRRTGATKPGALFSMETIPPEMRFNFKLIVENVNVTESNPPSNALRYLLKELLEGNVSIGGKTTSGLGRIQLENLSVNILSLENIKKGQYEYEPFDWEREWYEST